MYLLKAAVFIILAILIIRGISITILQVIVRRRIKRILGKFENKKILSIDPSAHCWGTESGGFKDVFGGGILILTQDELYFEMLLMKKSISIPKASIQKTESTNQFLNRTFPNPVLKVTFRNTQGQQDTIAWAVKDVLQWHIAEFS